jgi:N-acetylneuraminic acid mutarotase
MSPTVTNHPPRGAIIAFCFGVAVLALGCGENPQAPTAPAEPTTVRDQPTAAEFAVGGGTWVAKTAMPTARVSLAAAVVKNSLQEPILYAIGGDDGNGTTLSTVEAYNLATNVWSTKAPLPGPLEGTNGVGVIAGKLYVPGGRDLDNHSPGSDDGFPRRSLYVYDPASNSWSRKADMPQPSMYGVTGVINGKLYVLDGFGSFYRYNPIANTWSTLPARPGGITFGAGAVLNGKFYVAGGFNGSYAVRKLHEFDPLTNRWSAKALMPRAIEEAAAARLLGQLYMLGGISNDRVRDYVQAYDPVTNTWTLKTPLPTGRVSLAAAYFLNVNGKQRIVAIGGYGGLGDRWLRSNDVYRP